MNQQIERMKELSQKLQEASKAYYQEDREVMSNLEYDRLYDELQKLEQESGVVLAGSPTVTVGYEALETLPKERHESPMLSLGKTKERSELVSFAGGHKVLMHGNWMGSLLCLPIGTENWRRQLLVEMGRSGKLSPTMQKYFPIFLFESLIRVN